MLRLALFLMILSLLAGLLFAQAAPPAPAAPQPGADPAVLRAKAMRLLKENNWKEAGELFVRFATDPATDPEQVANDLNLAASCLANLGRHDQFDDLLEKSVAAHAKNWRLLVAAANQYQGLPHQGFISSGQFVRGHNADRTGKMVFTEERDRVRALQLFAQASPLLARAKPQESSQFHLQLAQFILHGRGFADAWRLADLTDLAKLPDYDETPPYVRYGRFHGQGGDKGAPVTPDGTPLFHRLPNSWDAAASDGERWRWCLQAARIDPNRADEADFEFANFHFQQFGVHTMLNAGYRGLALGDEDDRGAKNETGPFAVRTLTDDQTIARLATGIKRLELPVEFNYIRIYRRLFADAKGGYRLNAGAQLAQIYENRQQHVAAAKVWREMVPLVRDHQRDEYQARLDQIEKPWGRFEPVVSQPAGVKPTFDFRFRNGRKVAFSARVVDVPRLLADTQSYLEKNPDARGLKWEQIRIEDIGSRILHHNQEQYLGAEAARWELDLDPRPEHLDRRVSVAAPLEKAGAYWITARIAGGNEIHALLWVADTILVQKPLADGKSLLYVADAQTGQGVPGAKLSYFGWRQRWVEDKAARTGKPVIDTLRRESASDAQGLFTFDPKPDDGRQYQWMTTATTAEGRFAFLGYTHLWTGAYHDAQYSAVKTLLITDRPVYRPAQTVQFKIWVARAQYDQQQGPSPFAGQSFNIQLRDPKGEKIRELTLVADEFGGLAGSFDLARDATLGVYSIQAPNGGGTFRVEEYKKPEFEVKVDAPSAPVALGDKITATLSARYLFGAPVAKGTVKYKVLRSAHQATWYPPSRWDWLLGPGYWWFGCDYRWYPGWSDWGTPRPVRAWWPWWRPQTPPEVVAEAQVPLAADGTLKIDIDTALAKAVHGDEDHRYEITAEVTDASRRVIVGQGSVLVARKPFKVYAWVDRGHYRAGDAVRASFCATTLDQKPVAGKGTLRLLRLTYDAQANPKETEVERWALDPDAQGKATIQLKAARPGQYRLSYKVSAVPAAGGADVKHVIEGGYVFCVLGDEPLADASFRFNDVELIPDRADYKPGDEIKLQINANRENAWVLLFVRPSNGIYLPPRVLQLKGKSAAESIAVALKDMPNFFIEACTVSGGKVFTEVREIAVPPESRVLDVKVTPSASRYKPGEKASVEVQLTDAQGKPFVGSTVVSIYDKAVEYISGGSNVPEIRAFFWKWSRAHMPRTVSNDRLMSASMTRPGQPSMADIGVFGHLTPGAGLFGQAGGGGARRGRLAEGNELSLFAAAPAAVSAPMGAMKAMRSEVAADAVGFAAPMEAQMKEGRADRDEYEAGAAPMVEPSVRSQFADTALWAAAVTTDAQGKAKVELTMPENLTAWTAKVWAMGAGTRVGQGDAQVVTSKDLLVRLQSPRFFVEKDEVVLSANVHSYLDAPKSVRVVLELEGDVLKAIDSPTRTIKLEAKGEARVDWRVRVAAEGQAKVRMKALSDTESDAMEMSFPAYVHGMLKTDSFTGSIPAAAPDQARAGVALRVPQERRTEQSRLEIRYSPTLAGAMVDALPYLVDYPYGCTEQTLSRFLPTVITQRILLKLGVDLRDVQKKRTNLNAQEIGDDVKRVADWKRLKQARHSEDPNPVFDIDAVRDMSRAGLNRLLAMQVADGGWGWFSGIGEASYPHTTAHVVHGLQIAKENDLPVPDAALQRGVEWLSHHQAEQLRLIRNAELPEEQRRGKQYKPCADDLDAFVYMVLVDAGRHSRDMQDYLFRDRGRISAYSLAMFGVALHHLQARERLEMVLRNLGQFLQQDDENQTAYLRLPDARAWWCWHGSSIEANAYYLKLLARTDPKGAVAPRLVKYLLNNRRHATWWNSTRDTALCIEALADYLKASGEDKPDMKLEVLLDGKRLKEVEINAGNLFTFDNKAVLEGAALTSGEHRLELVRRGTGPVYFNAYLTNFTLEDPIDRAGLEVKIDRAFYRLVREEKSVKAQGSRGQSVDQRVEKYRREPLANLAQLKSGDLIEVELTIDSKNDYEYLIFEDMKPAGFEAVEVRSGYNGNELGAYVEYRDERVAFFVRQIARGSHSMTYRLRAETPGRFSALPARASAMYAPELRGNSREWKLVVTD